MPDYIWAVLIKHADRSSWIDSAFEDAIDAERRATKLESFDGWLDAYVVRVKVESSSQ